MRIEGAWCLAYRHWCVVERRSASGRKLHGHYAYYGITGSAPALVRFPYEVRNFTPGKPYLVCGGCVQELFGARGISASFLSICDEDEYAAAFVDPAMPPTASGVAPDGYRVVPLNPREESRLPA